MEEDVVDNFKFACRNETLGKVPYRITAKDWQTVLLNNEDTVRVGRVVRKIKGVDIGYGVVELQLSDVPRSREE